jgi:hypothetical protein
MLYDNDHPTCNHCQHLTVSDKGEYCQKQKCYFLSAKANEFYCCLFEEKEKDARIETLTHIFQSNASIFCIYFLDDYACIILHDRYCGDNRMDMVRSVLLSLWLRLSELKQNTGIFITPNIYFEDEITGKDFSGFIKIDGK